MRVTSVHGTIMEAVQERIRVVNEFIQNDDFPSEKVREIALAEFSALNLVEALWMTQSVLTQSLDIGILKNRIVALKATALQSNETDQVFPWLVADFLSAWIQKIERLVYFEFKQEQMN